MQAIVDICNTALSYLGGDANIASIDPPEASVEAEKCALLFPKCRDLTLQSHDWGFASGRVVLSQLDRTRAGWLYVYAAPSDMIEPRAVLPDGWQRDDEPTPFTVEIGSDTTKLILTDVNPATLRYTRQITNPALFTPLFCDAVAWLLASRLAGSLLKGEAGRTATKECYQMFRFMLGTSSAADANAQHQPAPALPDWIEARQ